MQTKTNDNSQKAETELTWKTRFGLSGIFQTMFVVMYFATRREIDIPDWWDMVLLVITMISAPMGLYSLFRYALIKHDEDKAAQADTEN